MGAQQEFGRTGSVSRFSSRQFRRAVQRMLGRHCTCDVLESRQMLSGGVPDPSFGTGGAALIPFQGTAAATGLGVAVDQQGRSVVISLARGQSAEFINVARYTASGALDSTFGNGGQETVAAGFQDQGWAVTIDSQDRIVIAGDTTAAYDASFKTADMLVARLNTDGSLDTSFNGTGEAIVDFGGGQDQARAIAIQADGKIVVGGFASPSNTSGYEFALARFNTDGTLDTGFGSAGTGRVLTNVSTGSTSSDIVGLGIDSSQRIVAVGEANTGHNNSIIARYNVNGTLDTSFAGTGILSVAVTNSQNFAGKVDFTSDGRLVIAGAGETYNSSTFTYPNGYDVSVIQLNTDGSFDGTFANGGVETFDYNQTSQYVYAVRVLSSGDIELAGYDSTPVVNQTSSYRSLVMRLNANGTLDTSYNGTGRAAIITGGFDGAVIGADGTVTETGVPSSSSSLIAVSRTTPAGVADASFGTQGLVTTMVTASVISRAEAIALQGDGKSVVAGYTLPSGPDTFTVARLNTDGSLDAAFGNGGEVTVPFSTKSAQAFGVAIQPDGKIVVVGQADMGSSNSSNYDLAVARLNADGTLDSTFADYGIATFDQLYGTGTVSGGSQDCGYSVAITADNKIVIAGISSVGGAIPGAVVLRLTSSGTLDNSFHSNGRQFLQINSQTTVANAVAVDSSGNIVIGGYYQSGIQQMLVARYTSAGVVDTSFGTGGTTLTNPGNFGGAISSIAIQSDGRIDAGGNFNNSYGYVVARYTTAGKLDTSFNTSGYRLASVTSDYGSAIGVTPMNDGGVLVGGGSANAVMIELAADGSFESNFGTNGIASSKDGLSSISDIGGMAVRPNGSILLAGEAQTALGTGFNTFVGQFSGLNQPAGQTITGNVFADFNGNGVQDSYETGIAGSTVYIDLNGNGVLDSNEPSALTTSTGSFTFSNLATGSYLLRIIPNAGCYVSSLFGSSITVNLNYSATPAVSFGVAPYSTLSGEVYNDALGSGFSTGNAGKQGVTIFLDVNADGVLDTGDISAVTDSNGNYTLSNCPAGTYTLREVTPANTIITQPQYGGEPGYYVVSLSILLQGSKPFGNFTLGTASGTVFNDLNGNGQRDQSEPGLSGVTVFADVNGTGVLASNDPQATTDANGNYSITGLGPGYISLYAESPSGFEISASSASTRVTSGSNINFSFPASSTAAGTISGTIYIDPIGSGQIGNEQPGGAVQTVAYIDLNNNGQPDAGEPVATFDSNGLLTFSNIAAGTYVVRQEIIGTPWVQTIPAANAGVTLTVSGGQSSTFSFADFHVRQVSGNFNTTSATGTSLVPAQTTLSVTLNSPSGQLTTQTVYTDSYGNYQLGNIGPGTVTVTPSVPAGYSVSPTSLSVASASGVNSVLNFTATGASVISGTVFSDDNANGVQDSGEASLSGITMYLDVLNTPGGSPIQTLSTTTTSSGNYSFSGLAPGIYVVRESLPSSYQREVIPASGGYAFSPLIGGTSSGNNFADLPYIPNKELSGTIIGTSGSYNNDGNTISKAFDGSFTTFFDAPTASGSWVGLDLGTPKLITQVSYASRSGYASRMNGGTFQVSNSANFSAGVVNLYTIPSNANISSTALTNTAVSQFTPYRYIRYVGPANSNCNVSELEFFGVAPSAVTVTGTAFNANTSTPSLTFTLSGALSADPGISAIDLENISASTSVKVSSSSLLETYNASAHTITITFPGFIGGQLPAGVYTGTLIAADLTDTNGLHPAANSSFSFLTIPTNGKLSLATGRGTLSVQQINVANGGLLDLGNNNLILTSGGSSGYSELLSLIQSGYHNGSWQGASGIVSSAAAGDSRHLSTLGLVLSSGQTFEQMTTHTGDVLLKYTYYGDANLDGKVDGSDYSRIDNGMLTHATGWYNGDFNYDGVINGSDYTLIDNAFNNQGAVLASQTAGMAVHPVVDRSTWVVTNAGEIGSEEAWWKKKPRSFLPSTVFLGGFTV